MLAVPVFIVSTLVFNTHGQKNKENDRNIKWTIKFSPIVFGKDAILFCNLSSTDHCCANTVTWMKDYDIIVHHGASTNSSKYQQIEEKYGFSLVIKHFDEKDINCQYACLYRFDTYSSILRINSNDFELRPTNETTKKKYTINGTQLVVDISFEKVFPSPQCEIMMNERILQSKSEANETTNGLFLKSHIKLICEMQSLHCSGNISVQCLVGKTQVNVIETDILHDCKTLEGSSLLEAMFTPIDKTIMEAVPGISVSVFLAFISIALTVKIYRKKLTWRRNCCVDLKGDETQDPLLMPERSECVLEIISEYFNNRYWVPSQRNKDVIKWLQVVVFDSFYLHLVATNIRINQIRNTIRMGIVEYASDMCSSTRKKILFSRKIGDDLFIIRRAITTDYKNMLLTATDKLINEARTKRNELDSLLIMYDRRYVDVLRKMTENRSDAADNALLLNVSNTANKVPRLKLKAKSSGDSYYIGKKSLSKKEKDINLSIEFHLREDEKNMLVTASNNKIDLAKHLLWQEKNRLDSEYRAAQVCMTVQQSPTRNDGPPISRLNRIKHDMDLLNAIATFKKTNNVYCLLMAGNIRINKARMKTS